MEIFRGLRDIEKHILKFLPNRDVVRLKRVCKTWQNMLHSIEIDRIQRIPAKKKGIWQKMITERYDDNCVLFLFGIIDAINVGACSERVYVSFGQPKIRIYNIGSSEYLKVKFGDFHSHDINWYPEIKKKTRWLELFPEDK